MIKHLFNASDQLRTRKAIIKISGFSNKKLELYKIAAKTAKDTGLDKWTKNYFEEWIYDRDGIWIFGILEISGFSSITITDELFARFGVLVEERITFIKTFLSFCNEFLSILEGSQIIFFDENKASVRILNESLENLNKVSLIIDHLTKLKISSHLLYLDFEICLFCPDIDLYIQFARPMRSKEPAFQESGRNQKNITVINLIVSVDETTLKKLDKIIRTLSLSSIFYEPKYPLSIPQAHMTRKVKDLPKYMNKELLIYTRDFMHTTENFSGSTFELYKNIYGYHAILGGYSGVEVEFNTSLADLYLSVYHKNY